ncbi:hypothetical protein GOM71_20890 [Paenibacillus sp. NEAU-GSW1]|nr:hypothetical protein [Paenibacillus sp. NEAU-GSW1]
MKMVPSFIHLHCSRACIYAYIMKSAFDFWVLAMLVATSQGGIQVTEPAAGQEVGITGGYGDKTSGVN